MLLSRRTLPILKEGIMVDDRFDSLDSPRRVKRRKKGAFIWILLTLVVLGGLSVLSLVLGSAAMDNDAVSMDPGQVFQGIGIAGIILTLVVIVVIVIVTSE